MDSNLKDEFDRIEQQLKNIENASNDKEVTAMLTSYFIVYVCGIYENIVEQLIIQRAHKTKDKEIENFMSALMDKYFRTTSYNNIQNLIKMFKGEEYSMRVEQKSITALGSLVTNRNKVAHGEYSNATINDCKKWHEDAKKIFEEIKKTLLKE